MKLTGFKPTLKLLVTLLILAILCLSYDALLPQQSQPVSGLQWTAILVSLTLVVSLWDAWRAGFRPNLKISRTLKSNLSVNNPVAITLTIHNDSNRHIRLALADLLPPSWAHDVSRAEHSISAQSEHEIQYQTTPGLRGLFSLPGIECRVRSDLGLWHFDWLYSLPAEVRVYPDFRMLHDLSGLKGSAVLNQTGIRQFHKRGSGMDFKQLRDYRTGESLRQVDWRATSRFNKLISREFQDEKNQSVVIMLDAGQRMMVQDNELQYFDHALNTLIALSHTILKNGDELSLMSFGQSNRWLGKVKGVEAISQVLNHFFDLHPQSVASDYLQAASQLIEKCPKRSLVMLVSCLRDEDFSDLLLAVKLLQKHHLVVVASIQDSLFDEVNQQPIDTRLSAGTWLAAQDLTGRIARNQKALEASGAICISAKATGITPSTINTYLKVKKAGIL